MRDTVRRYVEILDGRYVRPQSVPSELVRQQIERAGVHLEVFAHLDDPDSAAGREACRLHSRPEMGDERAGNLALFRVYLPQEFANDRRGAEEAGQIIGVRDEAAGRAGVRFYHGDGVTMQDDIGPTDGKPSRPAFHVDVLKLRLFEPQGGSEFLPRSAEADVVKAFKGFYEGPVADSDALEHLRGNERWRNGEQVAVRQEAQPPVLCK